MGTRRDARFECGCCDATVVYRSECPRETVGPPVCVCGDEMRAIAESGGTQKA